MNIIIAVFQSFRCPKCDTFFKKSLYLEQHLTTRSERVESVDPKNIYHTQEIPFLKLDSLRFEFINEQALFKKVNLFEFESIRVQAESFNTPIQQIGLESIIPS